MLCVRISLLPIGQLFFDMVLATALVCELSNFLRCELAIHDVPSFPVSVLHKFDVIICAHRFENLSKASVHGFDTCLALWWHLWHSLFLNSISPSTIDLWTFINTTVAKCCNDGCSLSFCGGLFGLHCLKMNSTTISTIQLHKLTQNHSTLTNSLNQITFSKLKIALFSNTSFKQSKKK